MTLIVGIVCSDGVVLAADSAATFGSLGQRTIQEPSSRKIQVFNDCVAVCVSGPVGLSQRIARVVDQMWNGGSGMSLANTPIRDLHPVDAGVEIRQRIWPHLNMEFAAAAAARAVFGQAAQVSAECASLVALPLSGKIAMIEFDQQGAPEVKTDELPFVSIGSGQPIADPFLAFLRQVFWKTRKPSTLDGVFAAHWTLQHAIRTNPGGIGGGVQIVVLTDGDCKAHELTPNELVDHHEAWSGAEEYLSRYRETLHGKMKGVSVPEPPSPAGGPPDLPDPQTP